MQDVKGKIRNDPAVINLFKAEPPVQDAHESLGSFAIARCATPFVSVGFRRGRISASWKWRNG